MKILVAGTRGIPNIPGGVEKHCQELYPLIVEQGHEVIVFTRTPYVENKTTHYKGVRLHHVFAPRKKSLEAIVHTMIALLAAWRFRPDIFHIHAIGPSLMIPLARLLGFTVVMTHHGPDYDRQKWGVFAKWALKAGEFLGGRYSNEVVVISKVIEDVVTRRCGRSINLVYNGVSFPNVCRDTDYLERVGISTGNYILAVARFVPEKGLHDLFGAFRQLNGDMKLVVAGDADHETHYSQQLKSQANTDDRIILTGYVTGECLNQLYSHAACFVLPSYHEGLPIALLEAMSYGLPPIVSDIPANLEVGLDSKHYFPCGDIDALFKKIAAFLERPVEQVERCKLQQTVARRYSWPRIARQTIRVYESALNSRQEIKRRNTASTIVSKHSD